MELQYGDLSMKDGVLKGSPVSMGDLLMAAVGTAS